MENLEKQPGIKLKSTDWHYRLMQWVWLGMAPDKNSMFNLCPYFWMLIATLLILPLYVPIRLIIYVFDLFFVLLDKIIVSPIVNAAAIEWNKNLDDENIYDIIEYKPSKAKIKYMHKILGEESKNLDKYDLKRLFLKRWFEKKNIKIRNDKNFYTDEYLKWVDDTLIKMEEDFEIRTKKKEKYKKSLEEFRNKVGASAEKTGEYILSFTEIIKWTKRIVGVIITLILTGLSFIIITFASKGILALISVITLDYFIATVILITGMLLISLILSTIVNIIDYANNEGWKDIWWAKLFMWTIGYPVYYIIFMSLKIIFYHFIWQLILVNIWFFLKASAIGLKNGFIEFGGIFGAYFGMAKGDYCPGIEWDSEENK